MAHRQPASIVAATALALCGAAFLIVSASLAPRGADAQGSGPLVVPPIPDPVAVTVDHSTTALLVGDVDATACPDLPPCAVTQPIADLLGKARGAGATVVFSTPSATRLPPPADAPQPGEILMVRPTSGPKWEGMAGVLQAKNIQTIVFVGNSLQNLILYGSEELTGRYGFTLVEPEDATVGVDAYRTAASWYQILNQSNANGNPTNVPLQPLAVTLSRSDLVTFN